MSKTLGNAVILAGLSTGGDAYAHLVDMNHLARRNNRNPKVVTVRKSTKTPRTILN